MNNTLTNNSLLKLHNLAKNIGKSGRITECSIAGYTGEIGKITEVKGNDKDGYRYTMKFEGGGYMYDTLYIPYFLVSVID